MSSKTITRKDEVENAEYEVIEGAKAIVDLSPSNNVMGKMPVMTFDFEKDVNAFQKRTPSEIVNYISMEVGNLENDKMVAQQAMDALVSKTTNYVNRAYVIGCMFESLKVEYNRQTTAAKKLSKEAGTLEAFITKAGLKSSSLYQYAILARNYSTFEQEKIEEGVNPKLMNLSQVKNEIDKIEKREKLKVSNRETKVILNNVKKNKENKIKPSAQDLKKRRIDTLAKGLIALKAGKELDKKLTKQKRKEINKAFENVPKEDLQDYLDGHYGAKDFVKVIGKYTKIQDSKDKANIVETAKMDFDAETFAPNKAMLSPFEALFFKTYERQPKNNVEFEKFLAVICKNAKVDSAE